MATIPDPEMLGRWLRATPMPEVWAAIDRVEWVKGTKVRAKNCAANFVHPDGNPHGRRIDQLRDVGPAIVTILWTAMHLGGPPPDPRDAEIEQLRAERDGAYRKGLADAAEACRVYGRELGMLRSMSATNKADAADEIRDRILALTSTERRKGGG